MRVRGGAIVERTYETDDPERGYPVLAFADYVLEAADEEQGYDVVAFEPVP